MEFSRSSLELRKVALWAGISVGGLALVITGRHFNVDLPREHNRTYTTTWLAEHGVPQCAPDTSEPTPCIVSIDESGNIATIATAEDGNLTVGCNSSTAGGAIVGCVIRDNEVHETPITGPESFIDRPY